MLEGSFRKLNRTLRTLSGVECGFPKRPNTINRAKLALGKAEVEEEKANKQMTNLLEWLARYEVWLNWANAELNRARGWKAYAKRLREMEIHRKCYEETFEKWCRNVVARRNADIVRRYVQDLEAEVSLLRHEIAELTQSIRGIKKLGHGASNWTRELNCYRRRLRELTAGEMQDEHASRNVQDGALAGGRHRRELTGEKHKHGW